MRVVFVSSSVPPTPESQTIRNVYLLRGLVDAGAEVDVVAPAPVARDESLVSLLPAGVRVHWTRVPLYDRVQATLARTLPGPLRSVARSGVAVALGRVAAPDVRFDWAAMAAKKGLELPRPDVVVSSAGSFTAHMAASRLVARWGVPWVAEYGDPWALNPLPPASHWHMRRINSHLERRALRRCTAMTVTTEETRQLYQRWLVGGPPIEVLPCGYDGADFGELPQLRSDRLVLSYIGTASRRGRNLVPLLRALSRLREERADLAARVELRLVGNMPPAFLAEASALGLAGVVATGPVSYADSVRAMRESDLLLLLGNRGRLQIPLKAFMYLGSGRPVIALSQMEDPRDDPTSSLVGSFAGTTVVRNEEGALAGALRDVLSGLPELAAAALERRGDPRLEPYQWENIGSGFARVVSGAAAAR